MKKIQLTLYYRDGCHLCEQMSALLYPLCDKHQFNIQDINIDDSSTLNKAYNADIPVLALTKSANPDDDIIILKHFFDYEKLIKALQQSNG